MTDTTTIPQLMPVYEDFSVHPAAELFPLIEGAEFDRLVEDIKKHGLREPIRQHPDGGILDGRNRLRACLAAGVDPKFEVWDGEGSAVDYVISLNLHRRHLTQSQAAMVATKALSLYEDEAKERMLAGVRQEDPMEIVPQGTARDQAGKAVGVSGRYVQDAKKLAEEAKDLAAKVESGELSLPAAKRELKRRKAAELAARREQVKELRDAGHTVDSIGTRLGISGKTVTNDLDVLAGGKGGVSVKGQQAERAVNQLITTLAALHHTLPRIDIQSLDWSLIQVDASGFNAHSRTVSVFIRDFRKELERHV